MAAILLSFQTMVYYEWNSAVILDEVERKEVDLEMEPHKGLVKFCENDVLGCCSRIRL